MSFRFAQGRLATPMVALTLALAVAACDDEDGIGLRGEFFRAELTRAPNVQTDASGAADFAFNGTTVEYEIVVHNITGVTAAHIHEGSSGDVIVPLFLDGPTGDVEGELVQGTFTSANVVDTSPVSFDQLIQLMRTGDAYVNVHTEANPGGEIQGDITPQ